MKKLFYSLILISICLIPTFVYAQIPQVSPTPPNEEADDVVKITTSLIQIDVVITDKKGKQLTDLKPEEVEIYENGKKQKITNFSYVSIKPNTRAEKISENSTKSGVPIPSKQLNAEQVRRTYALVVDDLGLSFGSNYFVKKALERFINEQMQQGDLVAIVRTGGGLGAVQSFTSDKNQLLAAIAKLKWNPQGRGGVDIFDPITTSLKEDIDKSKKNDATNSIRNVPGKEEDLTFQDEINQIRRDNFSVGTLGSLNFIIRGMRDLPGRKSVMLFSEGFVLYARTSTTSNTRSSTQVLEAMRVLADTANRSSVIIYTIDPRGLQAPGMANAADDILRVVPDDPGSFVGRTDDREREFYETQQSLRYLAEETGGLAYVNQNGLDEGLKKAVADQSYYLIGYEPNSETFDPKKNKYNKFEVKVTRPDTEVRYRTGFFAISDKEEKEIPQTPTEKIKQALLSPFGSNEIGLSLYAISGNDAKSGEFIRSLVNISAKDLKFTTEETGNRKANFDIIAMTFGDSGEPIDQVVKNYTIRVDEKTYQTILERGFVYDLPVQLKKYGAYQFRIALRDSETGKVGSTSKFIEVPKFKKKKLWLSNLMLESFTLDESKGNASQTKVTNRAYTDTTLRKFTSPVVLRYGGILYNAKNIGKKTQLTMQTRLISNGKVILESEDTPISTEDQTDLERVNIVGAFTLGNDLPPGDYIFQVIITDELAKDKKQIASQFIDFELVGQ